MQLYAKDVLGLFNDRHKDKNDNINIPFGNKNEGTKIAELNLSRMLAIISRELSCLRSHYFIFSGYCRLLDTCVTKAWSQIVHER